MKDKPLSVEVSDDELVIRIGINTLAHAAEHCERLVTHPGEVDPPYCKVDDALELAKDVRREMAREEEDGTSPLSDFLDAAIIAAYQDGSTGFAENETEEGAT